MVAPVVAVTYPPVIVKRKDDGTLRTIYTKTRSGARQKKPYNLPLPTSMIEARARDSVYDTRRPSSFEFLSSASYQSAMSIDTQPGKDTYREVYNKAYARLVDQLNGDAAFGINLVQRKEAMSLVANRALQLYNFTRHLRRFEFAKAADDLNLSRKRLRTMNLKSEAKSLGNNWLEFHFGWSPAIHDIYKAIDLSQNHIPDSFIRSSATGRVLRSQASGPINGNHSFFEVNLVVKVKLGTHLYVSNPNLWLANKMGLVNPASVLWDSVPFSFVVDWFVNLNAVMASWTDFAGLTLVNPWNSVFSSSTWTQDDFWVADSYNPRSQRHLGATITRFDRSLGIGSGPILKVKKPWTVSSTRGATAISLLLQTLRR